MKADAEGARIEQDTFVNSQQHSSMKYLGGGGSHRFFVLPWRQTVAAAQRGGVTCFTMVTMLGEEERLFPRRCALPASQMSSHDIGSRRRRRGCWLLISSQSGCSVLIILLVWVVFFHEGGFLRFFGLKSASLICYIICSIIDERNLLRKEKCCVWQRRSVELKMGMF